MFEIRVATAADAEAIRDIYAHYIRETAITFHLDPIPVEDFRQQIESGLKVHPWYVATDETGKVLGYAYASEHHSRPAYRWSTTSSIYLDRNHCGKGIGTSLYRKLLETLKRQGFRMVHAGVTMPNPGSQALHESLGFKRAATFPYAGFKFGAWRDVGWWVLDLMEGIERDQAVPEPTPFAKLSDSN